MLYKVDRLFGSVGASYQDFSWALMRLLGSAMFMTHGFSKLFGENPQVFRGGGMTTVSIGESISFAMPLDINALFIAGVIEFFGGLLLAIGLWTHLMALLAAILMVMAYLTAHLAWFPTLNRGELAAMYFLMYLVLFTFGGGQFSVDTWMAARRQKKQQDKMEANMSKYG